MGKTIAPTLSPREAAILRLASEGHTDATIARELGISEGTISTYWGRIRIKLGPHSRAELVAITIRTELSSEIDRLQNQRDRLKRNLERAYAAERLYEEIVDSSDEGVLLVHKSGRIEHANPVVLSIFEYERHELVGRQLGVLMPERYRVPHSQHVLDFSQSPVNRMMNEHSDTFGVTKSGAEVPLHISISSVHRDKDVLLTCFIHVAVRR